MKRIIAAALSVLVGAFGYTIVDKALEDRVATLESEVVELREEVSKYHPTINSLTTTTRPFTTTDNTNFEGYSTTKIHTTTTKLYQPTTSSETVGYTLNEDQRSKSRFLLRKYSNGKVVYVAPENLNNPPSTTVPQNSDSIPYVEYFLSVSNSSFVVSDIRKEVSHSYWYDKDYNLLSSQQTKTFYDLEIKCKGYTDPALSGYNLDFDFTVYVPQYGDLYYDSLNSRDIYKKRIISNKINSDGSFEYICVVTFSRNIREDFRCSLNYIYVDNPELYPTTTMQSTSEYEITTGSY